MDGPVRPASLRSGERRRMIGPAFDRCQVLADCLLLWASSFLGASDVPPRQRQRRLVHRLATPSHSIEGRILVLRGEKVLLDRDLAELYAVETKALNRAVRRNASRFPPDFMFALSRKEATNLKYQFDTSSLSHGGQRKLPLAFTEYGVAMLSSVLRSQRAIDVNIAIMRGARYVLPACVTIARHALTSITGWLRRRTPSHRAERPRQGTPPA
jgi:hypothetical protein